MDEIWDDERLAFLMEHWFPDQIWTLRIGVGGMNNTTRFVEAGGISYVLRIYETHRDFNKVNFEHTVLLALADQKLPYQLPQPMRLQTGGTVLTIDANEGKLAALFTFTEGSNPLWDNAQQLHRFGETVGHLSKTLASIQVELKPEYPPYYKIEHIHPRCTPEVIKQFCLHPPESFSKEITNLPYIWHRFEAFYEEIPKLMTLPHQLVHGDINGSNMLIDEQGHVVAVLDFEFVTRDVRVMELAVCVSDLIDPTLSEQKLYEVCSVFYEGYCSYINLKEEEIRLLPLLIELRRLDVFVHFLGRYLDGVDAHRVLIDIIHNTVQKVKWLEAYGPKLVNIFKI
ncbi:phosphotransferase [Paenibacillus sp. SYP-B3998]|uniref:Phosphotransferase n=1 Tax=Paenibacillus sp. SYP-B3998 TaxID=2678564 RepID=A0A6G3ZU98_9BACL|nr:phosphotransferase [Paenibacillus sp. SYP-B3998]